MAGSRIDYRAVAGTLVVHPQGWDDTPKIAGMDQSELDRQDRNQAEGGTSDKKPKHRWSTSPILRRVRRRRRGPLTFLFNGGPGSSTVWLHMGAFGPKRVVTADDTHSQAAPYAIVNNDQSLLDASDLVFVDAPGTGFSRIAGKDKEKAFYASTPTPTPTRSPNLSPRSCRNTTNGTRPNICSAAALINLLETKRYIDFNGVVLLSQILNFDVRPDGPHSIPASICPISCRCRLMPQPPGITTSWRPASRICRRSWKRSSISP